MTEFAHYYHIYADGEYWKESVTEHLEILKTIDVPYKMVTGIVGNKENCDRVLQELTELTTDIYTFDSGWEHPTLELLRDDVATGKTSVPVLYTHSKGAANKSDINTIWRQCMEKHVVGGWKYALKELDQGASTVGVHWLEKEQWPSMDITYPFYGGNYWWASVEHIKSLPPLSYKNRWGAEEWIGTVAPNRAIDLITKNTWPGNGCPAHS